MNPWAASDGGQRPARDRSRSEVHSSNGLPVRHLQHAFHHRQSPARAETITINAKYWSYVGPDGKLARAAAVMPHHVVSNAGRIVIVSFEWVKPCGKLTQGDVLRSQLRPRQ